MAAVSPSGAQRWVALMINQLSRRCRCGSGIALRRDSDGLRLSGHMRLMFMGGKAKRPENLPQGVLVRVQRYTWDW